MIKLTLNKVAVTPINDPDVSKGGIIIPDIAKERCDQGIVKYCGPDCVDTKVGQYVLFSGYTGTLVHVEGEGRIIIMPEDFIVAELVEPANVDVPGLYFRQPLERDVQYRELFETLKLIMPDLDNEQVGVLAAEMAKRGFVGPMAEPFFTANFEQSMEYISMAFQESTWYQGIQVVQPRPTLADYDKTRAGAGSR